MLLAVFQELFTWIMLLIILLNISQRKFPRTEKKRKATILLAVDFLVVYSIIAILSATALPMWLGWVCVAIGIIIPIVFLPFSVLAFQDALLKMRAKARLQPYRRIR